MTGGGDLRGPAEARVEAVLARLGPAAAGLASPEVLAGLVRQVEEGLAVRDATSGPVPPGDLDAPLTAPGVAPSGGAGLESGPAAGLRAGRAGSAWAWLVDDPGADEAVTAPEDPSVQEGRSPEGRTPEVRSARDVRSATPAPPLAGGSVDGPLTGWRLAVKDLIAVGGRPVTAGSRARAGARPESADAPVVARLRGAGAHLVGATRLHEFAFGTTGLNATGTPVNPAAPGRVPGGSSSGAAAVIAGGEADLSLGTDTGGSVRIPAALCGVVGFKPSLGAIPTAATFPLAPTLDHVGILVSRADQLVLPGQVLGLTGAAVAGPGPHRLGFARGVLELVTEPVALAFAAALDELGRRGFELVEVDWPGGAPVFAATTAIMFAEAARVHRHLLGERGHLYGADVRSRLVQGAAIGLDAYLSGHEYRLSAQRACLAVLDEVDGVLSPTVPMVAPLIEEASDPAMGGRLVTFTRLADLTGLPAVSIPLPGVPLPVGLQVEARTDSLAIEAAVALQRALGG